MELDARWRVAVDRKARPLNISRHRLIVQALDREVGVWDGARGEARAAAWSSHERAGSVGGHECAEMRSSERPSEIKAMSLRSPAPGDLLGNKYRVLAMLGAGAMGRVFHAQNELTGKQVALKWMHPEVAASPNAAPRLLREARTASKLKHANVVEIYDVVHDDNVLFLVMELLDGETLSEFLRRAQKPTIPAFIALLLQALDGVAAAHDQGVVHRDLKPDNIFIVRSAGSDDALVKVVDFGVAKLINQPGVTLTETGSAVGTPLYMSIEQLRGDRDVDERSDVYAFGVMLYEALTGRMPYSASSVSELAIKVATSDPVPIRRLRPEVPWSLARIVGRACARDREQRYANARALRTELARFANQREFRRVITIGAAPVQLAAASEGADLAQPEPGLAARPANYEPTQPTHVAAFPRTVFASETAARVRPRQLLASRRRIAIVIALGLAILTAAIMTRRRASSAALAPVLPAVIERWSPPAASASAPPVAEAHPPTVTETLNPSGSSSMAPVAEVPSTAPAAGELRSSRRPETKLAHKPRAASVSPPASPHPDPLKVLGF